MQQFGRAELTFDVREGGPDSGEPVVLLHGFPQDSTSWNAVEPLLHGSGLHTFAPDQRGYSPAARPRGRRAYTIGELADDVLALLDEAGLASAHIVGHDWGGAVAWMLGGRNPERVRSLTVLSTPHPGAMIRSLRASNQGLKSSYMLYFQLPGIPERKLARELESALRKSGLPAEYAAHNAERMREPGALTGALNWYRAIPLGLRTPAHRSAVRTTYVWGRRDPFLGRFAAEATAAYVVGQYRFVELDAGHWLPETHPGEVARLVTDQVQAAG